MEISQKETFLISSCFLAGTNYVYTKRETKKMMSEMDKHFNENNEKVQNTDNLLEKIPLLQHLIFNKNLNQIIKAINPEAVLINAKYFDMPKEADSSLSWHQDVFSNKLTDSKKSDEPSGISSEEIMKVFFSIRIHLDDTNDRNGALKIVPGSHNKILSKQEIKTISDNCLPFLCEIPSGGIHLIKPLLLHLMANPSNQKRRRLIHLEFGMNNK